MALSNTYCSILVGCDFLLVNFIGVYSLTY